MPGAVGKRPDTISHDVSRKSSLVERMRARWGVGPIGVVAILTAFALAGLTTVRLKAPVMGWLFPVETPGWITWPIYLVLMLPIYQLLLLGYGTLLGQFDFFWTKFKAIGRLLVRRTEEGEPSV